MELLEGHHGHGRDGDARQDLSNNLRLRRGVKKVPKEVASLARGGPGYALLTEASRAAGVRLAFADF